MHIVNVIAKTTLTATLLIAASGLSHAADIFPASVTQSWIANQPVTVEAKKVEEAKHPSLVARTIEHAEKSTQVALK